MEQRLFIVSNRLPVVIEDGIIHPVAEGMISAIKLFWEGANGRRFSKIFWAGTPECSFTTWSEVSKELVHVPVHYLPVFVPPAQYEGYHAGFCCSLLWPLFNNSESFAEYNSDQYSLYHQVNEKFLQVLNKHILPGDAVWIHDYQLMLLPQLMRKEVPELTIGFFLHTPFPPFNRLRFLPGQCKTDLLNGVLGADLIGFKANDHASCFLQSVQLAIGLQNDRQIILYNDRLIKVGVFPVSSDSNTVYTWVEDLLNEMHNIKRKQQEFQIKFLDDYSRMELLDNYRKARKRLLLLDYDGTLKPFASTPGAAFPGEDLLQLLYKLRSGKNTLYLISGRNSEWLDQWFGQQDLNLNLVAEHGARFKSAGGGWRNEVTVPDEWKEPVKKIMETYVQQCINSFVEEKDFSIVWHYRNVNPNQGKLCAAALINELNEFVKNQDVKVFSGKKIVEVKLKSIDKGAAVKKILNKDDFDFILAVGDDYTDEDMFKLLAHKENCYTIKVGNEASFASYNLYTPQMVISLLEKLSHISE
jgi:trehalose 6-phosphate synthase/phosphatase